MLSQFADDMPDVNLQSVADIICSEPFYDERFQSLTLDVVAHRLDTTVSQSGVPIEFVCRLLYISGEPN
ncbi:hypothetical protein THIOM_005352 [Candidatus Thiomargarita nelsonii]|uniref:Uncharacterized protein n=1 Tax=Candidatus Thiomargarita nelsonii TaxID=1003181 RepID=A0A176RTJ3_9GAMM|nr:hypothetical protein THIOM_005352 [Candidatus Thiomargarita nelsonii]